MFVDTADLMRQLEQSNYARAATIFVSTRKQWRLVAILTGRAATYKFMLLNREKINGVK